MSSFICINCLTDKPLTDYRQKDANTYSSTCIDCESKIYVNMSIHPPTRDRLQALKQRLKTKTYDQLINRLIDHYEA